MLSTRLSLFTVFFMMASVSWAKFANWKEYCDQNIGPKNQYHYVGDYLLNQFDTDKSEDNRKEMLTEAVRLYCRAGLNGAKVDPDVKAFKEKHHPSWDQIRPFHEKEKAVLKFFGKAGYLWENDAAWFAEGGVDSIKEKWIAANALSAKSSRESLVNWAKDDSMKDFLPGIKERAERDEQRAIDLKNGAQKTASWENILYKITTIWDEEAKKDSRMDDRDKNMEMDHKVIKHFGILLDALLAHANMTELDNNKKLVSIPDPNNQESRTDSFYGSMYTRVFESPSVSKHHRRDLRGTIMHNYVSYYRANSIRSILESADEGLRKKMAELFGDNYNLSEQIQYNH